MRIQNNVQAFNAFRNLSNSQNMLGKSLEKLSSGYRINRAADDAAGLVTSENLRAKIGGLQVASRNAQDGISVVQTAEGALTEVHSILGRMRDLAVQAANTGGNTTTAVEAAQAEVDELSAELDRIFTSTKYGDKALFSDAVGGTDFNFQIGADSGDTISLNIAESNVKSGNLLVRQEVFGGDVVDADATLADGTFTLTTGAGADSTIVTNGKSLTDVASEINAIDGYSAQVVEGGASGFRLRVSADEAGLADAALVVSSSTTAVLANGNSAAEADAVTLTGGLAGEAIDKMDAAISRVSELRGQLGAFQNRMESTIRNLGVATENLTAAESRIRDADMALETVSFTKNQVLQQAGVAMLAQANVAPQSVLRLLG